MRESKFVDLAVMAMVILFLLFSANLLLGLGIGILSLAFSVIGALLKLVLSKEVITLAAIGLVVYLFTRRKRDPYSDYPY